MEEYDCSFDRNKACKYNYIVLQDGDLDINNFMLLKNLKDVELYFKETLDEYDGLEYFEKNNKFVFKLGCRVDVNANIKKTLKIKEDRVKK